MAANFGPGGKGESPLGDAAIAGEVSERITGEAEDEEELEGLPEHERDTDTTQGAGLTSSGVMAEQRGGEGPQPFDTDDEEADADR
jgi:hypothetical protein